MSSRGAGPAWILKLGQHALGILSVVLIAISTAAPTAHAASGAWYESEAVSARLVATVDATGEVERIRAGLHIRLADNWKTYWRSPGDAGIAPTVDWSRSENVASVDFQWPAPHRFTLFGIETFGYEHEVLFPLVVQPERPGASVRLNGSLDILVCSDICVPISLDLALDLPSGEPAIDGPNANLINRFAALVPDDGTATGLAVDGVYLDDADGVLFININSRVPFGDPDVFVEAGDGWAFGPPAFGFIPNRSRIRAEIPVVSRPRIDPILVGRSLTVTIVDGARAAEITPSVAARLEESDDVGPSAEPRLFAFLGLAVLGGLILNLMPCVLPVLSIKLLNVMGKAGQPLRAVRSGFLVSAAGVLTSFWILALGLIAAKAAGITVGWGIQFQQPLFLAVMVVILTLFAANLLGVLNVQLPSRLATALGTAGGQGMSGQFLQGAFATLLATPCSAPFLGSAVGFALVQGPFEILIIFTALGIGLALPYLLVAAFPALAAALPRPGRWMIRLRQILSLALIGTAVWLLTVMAAQSSLGTVLVVAGSMGALLLALWGRETRFGNGLLMRPLATAIAAFALVVVAIDPASSGRPADAGTRTEDLWKPFDPMAVTFHIDEGHVVFIDVTADWCITCIVNKAAVLDRDSIATALHSERVIAMQADWTNPDPTIADFLARYGRYGIPFNVVLGPGRPDGIVLPELLSVNAVIEALAEASGGALES